MPTHKRPPITRRRAEGIALLLAHIPADRLDGRMQPLFRLGPPAECRKMRTAIAYLEELATWKLTSEESHALQGTE